MCLVSEVKQACVRGQAVVCLRSSSLAARMCLRLSKHVSAWPLPVDFAFWFVITLITHADAFRVSARDGFASTAAGVVRTGVVTTLCLALLFASSSSSMST